MRAKRASEQAFFWIDLRNFYPTFLMTDRIANIITVLLFLPFLVPSSLLYRLIDAWLDLKLKRAIIVSPSSLRILRAKKESRVTFLHAKVALLL